MKIILDYMNQIAALIESKKGEVGGPWQVFVLDRRLHVGKVALIARRDSVILALTKRDIENGLKNWQWETVQTRLMALIREDKII